MDVYRDNYLQIKSWRQSAYRSIKEWWNKIKSIPLGNKKDEIRGTLADLEGFFYEVLLRKVVYSDCDDYGPIFVKRFP